MEPVVDSPLSYALLADGTGDRALLPIIAWTLRRLWQNGSFAAPIFITRQHASIAEKLDEIVRQYRPDLVFVHRDAENLPYETRLKEIPKGDTTVPIVPVRMITLTIKTLHQRPRVSHSDDKYPSSTTPGVSPRR